MYQKLRRVNDRRHRELVYTTAINRANLREVQERRLYRKDAFSSAPSIEHLASRRSLPPPSAPASGCRETIGICEPVAFCLIAESYDLV